jgi:hypothetical protein
MFEYFDEIGVAYLYFGVHSLGPLHVLLDELVAAVDHVVRCEQLPLDLAVHINDLLQHIVDLLILLLEFPQSHFLLKVYFRFFIVFGY